MYKPRYGLLLSASLFLVLSLLMCSCIISKPLPIMTVDEFEGGYNRIAGKYGFSHVAISKQENVSGFVAFDGLFIVALSSDFSGNVYKIEISTGSSYAQTLTDDPKVSEALIYSAAVLSPALSSYEMGDDEIADFAKVIASSEGKERRIERKDFFEKTSSFILCRLTYLKSGGFKIVLKTSAEID